MYGWDPVDKKPINLGRKYDRDEAEIHFEPGIEGKIQSDHWKDVVKGTADYTLARELDRLVRTAIVAAPSDPKIKIKKPK